MLLACLKSFPGYPYLVDWIQIEPGAEMAILHGSPDSPGDYVLRFRTSALIDVSAHYHPHEEHITVLEGVFEIGFGDCFDASALTVLAAGAYHFVAAEVRHFARYHPGTVIQIHGPGPFALIYV